MGKPKEIKPIVEPSDVLVLDWIEYQDRRHWLTYEVKDGEILWDTIKPADWPKSVKE